MVWSKPKHHKKIFFAQSAKKASATFLFSFSFQPGHKVEEDHRGLTVAQPALQGQLPALPAGGVSRPPAGLCLCLLVMYGRIYKDKFGCPNQEF